MRCGTELPLVGECPHCASEPTVRQDPPGLLRKAMQLDRRAEQESGEPPPGRPAAPRERPEVPVFLPPARPAAPPTSVPRSAPQAVPSFQSLLGKAAPPAASTPGASPGPIVRPVPVGQRTTASDAPRLSEPLLTPRPPRVQEPLDAEPTLPSAIPEQLAKHPAARPTGDRPPVRANVPTHWDAPPTAKAPHFVIPAEARLPGAPDPTDVTRPDVDLEAVQAAGAAQRAARELSAAPTSRAPAAAPDGTVPAYPNPMAPPATSTSAPTAAARPLARRSDPAQPVAHAPSMTGRPGDPALQVTRSTGPATRSEDPARPSGPALPVPPRPGAASAPGGARPAFGPPEGAPTAPRSVESAGTRPASPSSLAARGLAPSRPAPPPPGFVPLSGDALPATTEREVATVQLDAALARDAILTVRPASHWRRLGSWLVDLTVVASVVALYLTIALWITGRWPARELTAQALLVSLQASKLILLPGLALGLVVGAVYGTLFAYRGGGRTLGRWLFGLKLVNAYGTPPGPVRATVRSVLALVSFALCLAGFWLAVVDKRGQTLHDKLTCTFVVRPA